ncbi:MAG: hypothetical protein U5K37_10220 [Natrialbaceae archaeon]|nr:hypothetical protein [Natrialbaceae archaeon]
MLTRRASEPGYVSRSGQIVFFHPDQLLSESIVSRAHRAGLAVVPWTVDDRAAMGADAGTGSRSGSSQTSPATLAHASDLESRCSPIVAPVGQNATADDRCKQPAEQDERREELEPTETPRQRPVGQDGAGPDRD